MAFEEIKKLEADLNTAKELRKQFREKKTRLFLRIRPLKEKLNLLECNKFKGGNKYIFSAGERGIKKLRGKLLKHWPEAINENFEEEANQDIELAEIMERIEKLRLQLGHGKTNWATEKQILKELEPLERRRELIEPEVKQAEAKTPKPLSRLHPSYDYWLHGRSKFNLKREIQERVNWLRKVDPNYGNEQQQEEVEKQIDKIKKQLAPLEKRYDNVKQEEEKATTSIVELQIQIKQQIALNDKFRTLQEKVKEQASYKERFDIN